MIKKTKKELIGGQMHTCEGVGSNKYRIADNIRKYHITLIQILDKSKDENRDPSKYSYPIKDLNTNMFGTTSSWIFIPKRKKRSLWKK